MISPIDILGYRKRRPQPPAKLIGKPFGLDKQRRPLEHIPPDELTALCVAARVNPAPILAAAAECSRIAVAKAVVDAHRFKLAEARLANMRPDLYAVQADAVRKFIADESAAIFFKPGVGKTRTMIELIHLRARPTVKVLWVCPRQVFATIRRELEAPRYGHYTSIVCAGTKPGEKLSKLQAPTPRNFYLINYHAFLDDGIVAEVGKMGFDVCVLDESHSIAAAKNSWTKSILSISHTFKTRFILTGTFAKNPTDVWSQVTFLDHGGLCGLNYYEWEREAVSINQYNRRQSWAGNWQGRVDDWLKRHAVAAELRDVVDMPEPIRHVEQVELGPEETRVYNEMRKDFIAILDDKELTAEVKIKQINYLRQITGGGMYLPQEGDAPREYKVVGDSKLGALAAFLELYPNEKILISHAYRREAERIAEVCRKAGRTVGILNGGTGDDESAETCAAFGEAAGLDVVVIQANKGVGIDGLQKQCAILVHFSRVYGWRANEQLEGRLIRGGQGRAVMVVELLAAVKAGDEDRATIDAAVLESIQNQYETAAEIVAALRRVV